MLITIYELHNRRFHPVKQYYWWRVPMVEELKFENEKSDETYMMHCPGCGRYLSRHIIRNSHQCHGTLTENPVPVKRIKPGKTPGFIMTK